MTVTAISHAALAKADACAALSRCPSVQTWLAVAGADAAAKAAAALPLIFLQDAGDQIPARYLIVTVTPRPPEKVAADVIHRMFDVVVECVTSQPSGAATAQEDFLFGLNLDEVGKEWMDQHEDGLLDFELVDVPAANVPLRDEDISDRAGDLLNQITATLECWGE
ncbi:MAG TPA: hypothetical protein VHX44_03530 [Planctomycetota bacterium]|jgi:hypothetical protein|nr:hypothetical protein [Planctomycetota bacterium]